MEGTNFIERWPSSRTADFELHTEILRYGTGLLRRKLRLKIALTPLAESYATANILLEFAGFLDDKWADPDVPSNFGLDDPHTSLMSAGWVANHYRHGTTYTKLLPGGGEALYCSLPNKADEIELFHGPVYPEGFNPNDKYLPLLRVRNMPTHLQDNLVWLAAAFITADPGRILAGFDVKAVNPRYI